MSYFKIFQLLELDGAHLDELRNDLIPWARGT